jgi:hypothetical protein
MDIRKYLTEFSFYHPLLSAIFKYYSWLTSLGASSGYSGSPWLSLLAHACELLYSNCVFALPLQIQ